MTGGGDETTQDVTTDTVVETTVTPVTNVEVSLVNDTTALADATIRSAVIAREGQLESVVLLTQAAERIADDFTGGVKKTAANLGGMGLALFAASVILRG